MKEINDESAFENTARGVSYFDSVSLARALRNIQRAGSPSEIYMAKLISLARCAPLYRSNRDSTESRQSEPRGISKL